ncbi:MAG: hypothetical protein ACLF0G_15300 [Candidatus Brocadiia bacterium]
MVDDYPRSLLLLGLVAVACAAAGLGFGGVGYALLAGALLSLSLCRYFLPTRYHLDDQGAAVGFLGQWRRVPWGAVRRVSVHREGVHLSPFARPSRLDSFRGTYLRFAGNGQEVVRFVRSRVAASE